MVKGRWLKTARGFVDVNEIEGISSVCTLKKLLSWENYRLKEKNIKVYQVGVITKSGRSYLVEEFRDEKKAEEFMEELAEALENAKETVSEPF